MVSLRENSLRGSSDKLSQLTSDPTLTAHFPMLLLRFNIDKNHFETGEVYRRQTVTRDFPYKVTVSLRAVLSAVRTKTFPAV